MQEADEKKLLNQSTSIMKKESSIKIDSLEPQTIAIVEPDINQELINDLQPIGEHKLIISLILLIIYIIFIIL